MSTDLVTRLQEAVRKQIHISKSKANLPKDIWDKIDAEAIAAAAIDEIKKTIESYAYIPCCHVSGMHDPMHFSERRYVCQSQKAEAFERLCRDLEINPQTKSKMDCGWCSDNPTYRNGEGMRLFEGE